jgi:ring-1,2-phenylacetyl-CoA epoxidase subunit PaaD
MIALNKIWQLLEQVSDPEIPVLSVLDMGIVRDIKSYGDGVEVLITPTYSGCPAMKSIEFSIIAELEANGIHPVKVTNILSPAWTTDWMSAEGIKKLKEYGIAPPIPGTNAKRIEALFIEAPQPECPHCGAKNTKMISQFGSTACKALYQCNECKEPFDYFKCH